MNSSNLTNPSFKIRSHLSVLIAAMVCLTEGHSLAASATWDTTSGSWGTPGSASSNWTPGTAPGASSGATDADTATFNTTGGASGTTDTVTLPPYLNILDMTFSGTSPASYLLNGGGSIYLSASAILTDSVTGTGITDTIDAPITLEGAANFKANASAASDSFVFGVAGTTTDVITNGGYLLTLSGSNASGSGSGTIYDPITGTGGVAVNSGNWTLSGADTYSGTTSVKGGNLTVNAGAGGSLSSSTVLQIDGNTFTYDGGSGAAYSDTLSSLQTYGTTDENNYLVFNDNGATSLTLGFTSISGANTVQLLNITMNSSTDTLEVTNTPGSTVYEGGFLPTFIINDTDIASVASNGTTNVVGVGKVAYASLDGTGAGGGNASPVITGTTTSGTEVPLIDSTTTGNITLAGTPTYLTSLVMQDTNARTLALGGAKIIFAQGQGLATGTILSATGAGALTIGSSAGDGIVQVYSTAATGNSSTSNGFDTTKGLLYLINDSSSVDTMNADIQDFASSTSSAVGVVLGGSGTWALDGANTYSGGTSLGMNAGSTTVGLDINSASALGTGYFYIYGGTIDNTSGAAVTESNNNPMYWNASFAYGGSNSLNLGTGTVKIGGAYTVTTNGSGTLAVGGVITNTSTLTKAGAGTLELDGNSGTTFTGGLTVAAGTLSGTGTVGGALTLNSGATMNPGVVGSSTGTFKAASLTFNQGATLSFNLQSATGSSPTSPSILDTELTLSGAMTGAGTTGGYNVDVVGGTVGQTYDLVNYGSTALAATSFAAEGDTGTFTEYDNTLDFTVLTTAAVPEPSSVALFLMGCAIFGVVFRRRLLLGAFPE